MVALGRWFIHRFLLALKFLSVYVHRSTLPQLRCAQQLPQRGSREGAHHSPDCSLISGVGGRFSSPLRNSQDFTFHHSSGDTPSVSHSLDSSLREGAGMGRSHSSGYSLKSQVSGDFHRPYEGSECFTFYHSSCRPETGTLRAIFIAPTEERFTTHWGESAAKKS